MSATARTDLSGLNWILEDLARIPHVRHVVLLTSDGLLAANSQSVARDLADTISAAAAGLQSLSRRTDSYVGCEGAPWEMTMIQFSGGYLILMAAGQGTYLALSAGREVDLEGLTFSMEKSTDRMGNEMAIALRGTPGAET